MPGYLEIIILTVGYATIINMKQGIILLIILMVPALSYAQPEIKFDTESYDLGIVTQEITMHSFEFRNTGTSELIIEKLVPS